VDRELTKVTLLMVELLIGPWAEIVQCQVSPASIVEGLDVEEQARSGLVTGVVQAVVHPLTFQRPEETLHVEPTFQSRDVGDVGQPFVIGALGDEVLFQQVRSRRLTGAVATFFGVD
jgi:hypothetical protein